MTADAEPMIGLLAPDRCLLLVVDKQRWYLDSSISPFLDEDDEGVARREVEAHDRFIEATRAAAVPVIWTRMTEGDHDAPGNVRARWLRRPNEPRLARHDPGFDFAGKGPAPGEPVIDKTYPDAFSTPALATEISDLDRSTVVLIGSYAGRCVLATAFGAQSRGLDVVVPRGLAEPHPRQQHEEQVFLAVIDSVVGYVIEPASILRRWGVPSAS